MGFVCVFLLFTFMIYCIKWCCLDSPAEILHSSPTPTPLAVRHWSDAGTFLSVLDSSGIRRDYPRRRFSSAILAESTQQQSQE